MIPLTKYIIYFISLFFLRTAIMIRLFILYLSFIIQSREISGLFAESRAGKSMASEVAVRYTLCFGSSVLPLLYIISALEGSTE